MQLRAPAKINLSFRVLRRREDGFHEIETLMTPIGLFDEITLEKTDRRGEIDLRCDDPSLPQNDGNLAVRAARLFLEESEAEAGVAISLKKNIPHGAGLAGGSSDAASVLIGLNRLFEMRRPIEQLSALAAAIGSDVPFFLHESAAVCRGRGELVRPAALSAKLRLLLLKPAFGVATPWAYRRWRDSRELAGIDYAPQNFAGHTLENDLERPVFEKYLFLAYAKRWLRAQAGVGAALMSGSGSTLFAVLDDKADAAGLAAAARRELDLELWTHNCETV